MKPISLSVSEEDYEAFRQASEREGRSIAALIRESMSYYRTNVIEERTPLETLPILGGHEPLGPLPSREELYDELYDESEQITETVHE